METFLVNIKNQYVRFNLFNENCRNICSKDLANVQLSQPSGEFLFQLCCNTNIGVEKFLEIIDNFSFIVSKVIITIILSFLDMRIIPLFICSMFLIGIQIFWIVLKENNKSSKKFNDFDTMKIRNYQYYNENGIVQIFVNQLTELNNHLLKNNIHLVEIANPGHLNFAILFILSSFYYQGIVPIMYSRNMNHMFTASKILCSSIFILNELASSIEIFDNCNEKSNECNNEFEIKTNKHNELEIIFSSDILYLKPKIIRIKPGDCFVIYGKSGCGKTTLINNIVKELNQIIKSNKSNHMNINIGKITSKSLVYFSGSPKNFITEDLMEIDNDFLQWIWKLVELELDIDEITSSEQVSCGEFTRICFTKFIYHCWKMNKNIIVMDEIDHGLNTHLFRRILLKLMNDNVYNFSSRIYIIATHVQLSPKQQLNEGLSYVFLNNY